MARSSKRMLGAVIAVGGLLCFTAGIAPAAWAQPAPATAKKVSLGSLMTGEGGSVAANANAEASYATRNFTIVVHVKNTTTEPVDVEVPYGTLFAPADDAQQTVVTSGPVSAEAASIARSGATPTVVAPPGESDHELIAYCGQKLNTSSAFSVPVSYKGVAKDPLPIVMRNIAAQQPDPIVAQDAVWWVTDDPSLPIANPDVEALLTGVNTSSFSAAPSKVVAQESYTPKWAGGSRGSSGPVSPQLMLIVISVLIAAGFALVLLRGRRTAATAKAYSPPAGPVPGWYRDPAGPHAYGQGLRYWDGRGWTNQTR